jgi:hypothetical protein
LVVKTTNGSHTSGPQPEGAIVMAEIVQFEDRKRALRRSSAPIIEKVVDGKTVECLDFELLSPRELSQLLTANSIAHALKIKSGAAPI